MCNCRFAVICKFFEPAKEQEAEICLPGKEPTLKKKGLHKKSRTTGNRIKGLTTKKEDIKRIRAILKSEAYQGRLTEEQMAALDEIGNTHYKNLTDGQKEQLLNIYYDPRRRKDS